MYRVNEKCCVPSSEVYIYRGVKNERAPDYIKEAIIHASVSVIGESAFEDCTKLTKVTLHDNVKKIKHAAFLACNSLETIQLPRNLEEIEHSAFGCCDSLEAIFLPLSIKHIEDDAFACSYYSLRFFHIPETISYIGDASISHCIHKVGAGTGIGVKASGHANSPLHRVCYSTDITAQDIYACINDYGPGCALLTDNQGMMPLHIIMANPHATAEAIDACYIAGPAAIAVQDQYGSTPLHYICKYKPSILKNLKWLTQIDADLFSLKDREVHVTPLEILMYSNNIRYLPFDVAIAQNIKWHHGMEQLVQNALSNGGGVVAQIDTKTGLHYFMLAAAQKQDPNPYECECLCCRGQEESNYQDCKWDHQNLSTVFTLLRANPDNIISCFHPQKAMIGGEI